MLYGMASECLSRSSRALYCQCNSLVQRKLSVRTFSASASTAAFQKSPESPDYIYVPKPRQPDIVLRKKAKGFLPVPREIFPKSRPDKPSTEYLALATQEPSKHPTLPIEKEARDHVLWKQRMAATRRRNLREGLLELYYRKQEKDLILARKSAWKTADRERRLNRPLSEDEVYTAPSVPLELQRANFGPVLDKRKAERMTQRKEHFKEFQASKKEENEEDLHSLYMNARTFITNEEQLDAEIERVFGPFWEGRNSEWNRSGSAGKNVWNTGPPPTVQDMLASANKTVALSSVQDADSEITRKRVRKIAEELTGGKM